MRTIGSGAVCENDSYQGMALAMPPAEAELKSAPVRRYDRENRAPQGPVAPYGRVGGTEREDGMADAMP
ncbi:MAG TPA: hypothetical protein VGV15_09580 [Terriglobales bacterium]|nr:hypothetical protein [Terriglobales bacterium]